MLNSLGTNKWYEALFTEVLVFINGQNSAFEPNYHIALNCYLLLGQCKLIAQWISSEKIPYDDYFLIERLKNPISLISTESYRLSFDGAIDVRLRIHKACPEGRWKN